MSHSYMQYLGPGPTAADPVGVFRSAIESEFYTAETYLEGNPEEVRLDYAKVNIGPVRIFNSKHVGIKKCGVKRSWRNIQDDSKKFFVVWFPVAGITTISQNQSEESVNCDCFGFNYADKPFHVEVAPDDAGNYESYVVALPLHMVNSYIPHLEKINRRMFQLSEGGSLIAKQTFIRLFHDAPKLPQAAIEGYVRATLQAISASVRGDCEKILKETDIKYVRLNSLLDYIDFNLSDPTLTAPKVAEACGISSRYLHLLFSDYGVSFSNYVGKKRLELARKWLTAEVGRGLNISQVAFMLGFKSISSFSRAFKAAYGYSPSLERNMAAKRVSKQH